jgi:hypothetical protein
MRDWGNEGQKTSLVDMEERVSIVRVLKNIDIFFLRHLLALCACDLLVREDG